MNNSFSGNRERINKMVICGVFAAFAYVCVCVFRIKVSFLTLDIKDAVITTAAMIINPIAGVFISAVVALLEMVTISDTSYYGFIMNFLSSATFSAVASLIYRSRKSLTYAIGGLVCAAMALTAVMMLANLFITPFYMGVERSMVVGLIPKLLLPFNITKAILNASLVMIIYKPIATALRRAKVIKSSSSQGKYAVGVKTVAVTLVAIAILVLCLVVFFVVLGADVELFLK